MKRTRAGRQTDRGDAFSEFSILGLRFQYQWALWGAVAAVRIRRTDSRVAHTVGVSQLVTYSRQPTKVRKWGEFEFTFVVLSPDSALNLVSRSLSIPLSDLNWIGGT